MNRLKIAQYIALGATVATIVGLIILCSTGVFIGYVLFLGGILASLVSYFFGGFKTAFKMAWGIAKWGWVVVPFPFDLLSGLMSFIFAIYVFFLLPIIPIRKAYKENR